MKISERLEKLPPYLFAQIDKKIDDAKKKRYRYYKPWDWRS